MTVLHTFAANIRRFRKQAGLSQEAFAERCGLHRTYISAVEREKRNISLTNVEKIARTLGVPVFWLFLEPPRANAPESTVRITLPPHYRVKETSAPSSKPGALS